MLEIGEAKGDITFYEEGMCMLGWGNPKNVIRGVAMPLTARAVVVSDTARGGRVAYLSADLCFLSLALRRRVMERLAEDPGLGLSEHNTALAATHTHSGPNGFGGHLYLDISAPGFSDTIFRALAERFVDVLRAACRRSRPGRAYYHSAEVPLSSPVMWNRAPHAYSRNHDVRPMSRDRSDEAVDRRVRVVRFDDASGRPVASVQWVALHGTTIHADNQLLHPDHMGIAAQHVEAWADARYGSRDFVAVFAQGAAGDVSPNYRIAPGRRLRVGRYDDDFKSAEHCGAAVARAAESALHFADRDGTEIAGPIAGRIRYVCLAQRGPETPTTSARLGLAMALGTDEGPGPLYPARRVVQKLAAWRTKRGLDPKVPFVDLGAGEDGRLFDRVRVDGALLSLRVPGMDHLRALRRVNALGKDWISRVLPLQLLRLGSLLVAPVPCEPTTVAGRRLEKIVRDAWAQPVTDVVVNGYANAYALYLVTPEEYDEQHYEAACTVFGRASLDAYGAELARLAGDLHQGREADLGEAVPPLDLAQLGHGRFVGPRA
jgi:neutral ceramidase